jgi:23S rRNA (cytidine2498-2'-O)-methyltransferase
MALPVWTRAVPDHPMIRARGLVLGKFEGVDADLLIRQILDETKEIDWQTLHVWQRDPTPVGSQGFEPGDSVLATEVAQRIQSILKSAGDSRPVLAHGLPSEPTGTTPPLASNAKILDVILDTPNRWWLAAKTAQTRFDRWPGGVPELPDAEEAISRAYLKIAEAFAWSGLAIRPGERIVEIGSSPGGACQWLLESGAHVTGIDPAEMDAGILTHPHFTHWRSRSLQIKRKAFRPFRILVCDANVTPNYTLDTVEAIVTYPTSHFRALVLTMKLPDWDQAEWIPTHCDRVRSWGFGTVEARQLAHNRREYCLVARRRAKKQLDPPPAAEAAETPTQ